MAWNQDKDHWLAEKGHAVLPPAFKLVSYYRGATVVRSWAAAQHLATFQL